MTKEEKEAAALEAAKLKAEAAAELKEAGTQSVETVDPIEEAKEAARLHEVYMNERLPFKAIWDGEKYKDDIVMTINGKNWVIQRGVEVLIPRFVLFAIYDSEDQKIIARRTSSGFEESYKKTMAANMM